MNHSNVKEEEEEESWLFLLCSWAKVGVNHFLKYQTEHSSLSPTIQVSCFLSYLPSITTTHSLSLFALFQRVKKCPC